MLSTINSDIKFLPNLLHLKILQQVYNKKKLYYSLRHLVWYGSKWGMFNYVLKTTETEK